MGDDEQPPPPPPPDYAAANRAGIMADIETLPVRRQIELAAKLGQRGSYTLDGKQYSYDFTSQGDAEFAKQQAVTARQTAMDGAQNLLDIQEKYGQRFLDTSREQLKASDPIGFALREDLGRRVSGQLGAGGSVTDSERRGVSQNVRAVQTRLGNTNGVAAGVQEALSQTDYQRGIEQQRLGNAGAFLAGTTPLSQFGQLQSAGVGAAPYMATGVNAIGQNANAGQMGTQFAANVYGTQGSIYSAQLQAQASQGNPWMQGLGIVAGVAGSVASAGILAGGMAAAGGAAKSCHVAREVYGIDDPRWMLFRDWLLTESPGWFRAAYIRFGERVATMIRPFPRVKSLIRRWMDSKINRASRTN